MTTLQTILHAFAGLAAGVFLAHAHTWASVCAARATIGSRRVGRALIGFPLRVALPALGLFGLMTLSWVGLAGGVLAFIMIRRRLFARIEPTTNGS